MLNDNSNVIIRKMHGERLRTLDLSLKPVFGMKQIPRTGSCEPVESHHCLDDISPSAFKKQLKDSFISVYGD